MIKNATTADMKPMVEVVNELTKKGYIENYKITGGALAAGEGKKTFKPEDISVINFYRFEGASDPADNAILYAIETKSGEKGMLVDAYGPYSDGKITGFMKKVEDINKENAVAGSEGHQKT